LYRLNIFLAITSKQAKKTMEKESKLRSVLKAVTWRCIATGTTFTLAYTIFSGSGCEDALQKSTLVAGLELVIKLVIYYFHERAWQAIPRGTFRNRRRSNPVPISSSKNQELGR
jgi:uncharacterized membrane protein